MPKIKIIPDTNTKIEDNREPSDTLLEKKDRATAGAIDKKIT